MLPKNALVSLFDKSCIPMVRELADHDWNLFASGGTAKALADAIAPVTDVAQLIGGDAILGHRVVTLSRQIHAGLLAQDTKADRIELETMGAPWIDLVIIDAYPLHTVIAEGGKREKIIESTDIGGPAMIASALKGGRLVICDTADIESLLEDMKGDGSIAADLRHFLTVKAANFLAGYAALSAWWRFYHHPDTLTVIGRYLDNYADTPEQWKTTGAFFSQMGADLTYTR